EGDWRPHLSSTHSRLLRRRITGSPRLVAAPPRRVTLATRRRRKPAPGPRQRRSGGTGRRVRFRVVCPRGRVGSSPTFGTTEGRPEPRLGALALGRWSRTAGLRQVLQGA